MATGEHITQWSTTAACTPAGSDSIGSTLDDELRQLKATVFSGSRADPQTKSTAYTSSISDHATVIAVTPSTSTLTVSLAAAATLGLGWRCKIVHSGSAHGVLIDGGGTDTLGGSITYSLTEPGEAVEVVSNGSDGYYVVNDHVPPVARGFASGTTMVFYQDTAPTGWTRSDVSAGGRAIRLAASGDVGGSLAGSVAFDTVFGLTATDGHTLTSAESGLRPHTHAFQRRSATGTEGTVGPIDFALESLEWATTSSSDSLDASSAHSHNIDLQVKYAVCILASRD